MFQALDKNQLSKLSIDAITGLTCEQLKTISGDEIAVFKPRKLKAIAVELVSCIRPATLDELNKRQVNALTNEQIAGLSKKQKRKAVEFTETLSNQQEKIAQLDTGRSNRFADLTDQEQALQDIINPDTLN